LTKRANVKVCGQIIETQVIVYYSTLKWKHRDLTSSLTFHAPSNALQGSYCLAKCTVS
jgi:hypothetical protein